MKRLIQNRYIKWYVCLEAVLFAGVLVTQILDLRAAEDFFVWLCITVNAVFLLRSCQWTGRFIMLLTFLADTLLVLLDVQYLWGVLLFGLVQALYAWYLYTRGYRMLSLRILLFMMPALLLLFFPGYRTAETKLAILAVFSFSQLLVNTVCSLRMGKETGVVRDQILAAGMILFLGCDVCVGLRNLPVPHAVLNAAYFLNWVFYVPSQVLITIHFLTFPVSGKNTHYKK